MIAPAIVAASVTGSFIVASVVALASSVDVRVISGDTLAGISLSMAGEPGRLSLNHAVRIYRLRLLLPKLRAKVR